jgi:hypothetical protein
VLFSGHFYIGSTDNLRQRLRQHQADVDASLRLRASGISGIFVSMAQHYDLAVIGSGSGGREAALLGARQGLRLLSSRWEESEEPAITEGPMLFEHCKRARASSAIVGEAGDSGTRSIF